MALDSSFAVSTCSELIQYLEISSQGVKSIKAHPINIFYITNDISFVRLQPVLADSMPISLSIVVNKNTSASLNSLTIFNYTDSLNVNITGMYITTFISSDVKTIKIGNFNNT